MAAPGRRRHADQVESYPLRLKTFAIRAMGRIAPSMLRFLAHRNPLDRGRWPALRALVSDAKCRDWLASLENPTRTRRGFRILTIPGDLTSDWIKLHGQHETGTERFILEHLGPGTAFIDVGANIGYFSLLAAVSGRAGVVAFEPQRAVADLLRRSAALNGVAGSVRVEHLALSDRPGVMRMTSCPGNTGHAQLVPASQEGAQADPVSVVVLDDWLDQNPAAPASVCKIDTEGSELGVLLGMRRLLARDGPALAIEMTGESSAEPGPSSRRIRELLRASGYAEVSDQYAQDGELNCYFVRRPRQGAPPDKPAGRKEGPG
jgi:FkbM family methyltransferase